MLSDSQRDLAGEKTFSDYSYRGGTKVPVGTTAVFQVSLSYISGEVGL